MDIIPVSENTERLFRNRRDDFRVDLIYDIMFDDNIGGLHANRTVTLTSDKEEEGSKQVVIAKAKYLDTYRYIKAGLNDMKKTIEENIQQIHSLKMNGAGIGGLPPIQDVWLFVFAKDDDYKIIPNTYLNPNSQDIGDILRSNKDIIMCGFVLVHPTVFKGEKLPEGYPESVSEWIFVSPVMEDHMEEYNEISMELENQKLKEMFLLDFKKTKLPIQG